MDTQNKNEQSLIRIKKIDDLKKLKVEPFSNYFVVKDNTEDIIKNHKSKSSSELLEENIHVSIAGRIITKRLQGKAGFLNVQDFDASIQVYVNKKIIPEKDFQIYENSDLGDIIGIYGFLFKTKTNELTVKALKFIHLSKSLIPLPDKYKGLKNKEYIRKKRYIDLIVNPETRKRFLQRNLILKSIRNFFDERGFLEVETPILNSFSAGALAKPFITHHNALGSNFFLRIATEIPLKKLIVGGMKAVYEIGRIFRNEGIDATHNPEFTTVEAYLAYANFKDMMDLTEELLKEVCLKVLGKLDFDYQEHHIDFSKFYKYDMVDIIKEKTNIDFRQEMTLEESLEIAKKHDIKIEPFFTKGHVIDAFFQQFVEGTLIQPTFIYNYPYEISPLANKIIGNEDFVDRFELFIAGKELVNAFTELNDPIEQKKRFQEQLLQKHLGNDEVEEIDIEFVETLEYGMPPTGGLGIGIDRLCMFLTNTSNIRDVILFPHFVVNKKNKKFY